MHNSIYEMCRKGSESEVKLLKKTEKCEGKFLEKDWKVACKAVEVYRKVGVQAIKTEKQKKKKNVKAFVPLSLLMICRFSIIIFQIQLLLIAGKKVGGKSIVFYWYTYN